MKKTVLFLSVLASILLYSQDTNRLIDDFRKQQFQNEEKYNKQLLDRRIDVYSESVVEERSRLAGFNSLNMPFFIQSEDSRGNQSANIAALQDGSLLGLNGTAITGSSQSIIVMDEGRVFEKHREFGADGSGNVATPRIFDKENSIVGYNAHATAVAGMLGAQGWGYSNTFGAGAAKGVLTNVSIDTYSFRTTAAGNNFQKLTAATNANISNHSYGTNLGWFYVSAVSATYPAVGWYWYGNYAMNSEDTYSGSYNDTDANFDKLVYDNQNQIVVKSTGNYFGLGPTSASDPAFRWDPVQNKYIAFQAGETIPEVNCSQGYNCIGWGSLAKNIIGVGAANQLTASGNVYTSPSDVQKWSKSSAGPRKDGAVKPDLTAVGADVWVANYTNQSTFNGYGSAEGTSFAAPIVAGVAGAVTEVTRNLTGNATFTYKADEMKALLTHTANEAGNPGPDVWFGWGFVDATKAVQLIIEKQQSKAIFERNSLNSGIIYSKDVYAKEGTPLKATISWVDPAGVPFITDNDLQNNHNSKLINDLDLRIIDTATNTEYFPWKLDISNPMANAIKGDNLVDNVEQVLLESPVAGRKYRVEVSNKGSLVNNAGASAPQNYSLIVTGFGEEPTMGASDLGKKTIAVYPTRTKDVVTILIPEGAKSIEAYDASGRNVLNIAAKSYQTVDFGKLPNGVYVINIKTDKETVSKKIIKE